MVAAGMLAVGLGDDVPAPVGMGVGVTSGDADGGGVAGRDAGGVVAAAVEVAVGTVVGVAIGVAVGRVVGVAVGVAVGTVVGVAVAPRQVTTMVAGQVAIVARTVRAPSACPKLRMTLVLPSSPVIVLRALSRSSGERDAFRSHSTACPLTSDPVSANRTVAVMTTSDEQATTPEGPSRWTAYGFWPI